MLSRQVALIAPHTVADADRLDSIVAPSAVLHLLHRLVFGRGREQRELPRVADGAVELPLLQVFVTILGRGVLIIFAAGLCMGLAVWFRVGGLFGVMLPMTVYM